MKRLLCAAFGLFVLAACTGDGTGSDDIVALSVSPDQPTITVGQSVTLQATGRDADGTNSPVPATFNTLNAAVATVDASTGTVTGVAAGTARVVASYRGRADTATVTVTTPAANCTAANALNLAVGQPQVLTGAAAASVCVAGGAAGAEYTVIPQFTSGAASSTLQLTAQATGGVVQVSGPPSPSLAPGGSRLASLFGAASLHDGRGSDFHVSLRERTALAMRDHVAGAQQWMRDRKALRAQVSAAPAVLGQLMPLNVSQTFCNSPDVRTGRVVSISQRAVVVEDTANPKPGLTQADFDHIAASFDTLVWPVNVATFGEPQDIDANGKVVIFYTRAVNELTPPNENFVVGGFFYGRDLFPKQPAGQFTTPCQGSNAAEMFYMLAADPNGAVNGHVRSRDYIMEGTVATVAHEFQHLISASRRLYVVGATGTAWNEDTWLNEGLSHIAEELLYFRAAGLAPRQNVGIAEVTPTQARVDAFNTYQLQNAGRYLDFLQTPETNSVYDDDDDLATRGGAWGFLRYVADRRAGTDQQLWFALVNSKLTGLTNLQTALGTDPVPWARDFMVSLYTDDALNTPAVYQQPSWNWRSVFAGSSLGLYPLKVRPLTANANVNLTLNAGSAAYLRLGVSANTQAAVALRSGQAPPPPAASVIVVRTK